MALTDPYATAEEYMQRAYKTDASTSMEDIENDLQAVSRYIDNILGRSSTGFNKDDTAVDRIYISPYGGTVNPEAENPWKGLTRSRTLYVDPIADLTDLVVTIDINRDGTFDGDPPLTWNGQPPAGPSDFICQPLNAPLGPDPSPYTALWLVPWGTTNLLGWIPNAMVKVHAIWGWPKVPQIIHQGTLELTSIWRVEGPRATNRIDEMGSVFALSKDAQSILQGMIRLYKKPLL